MLHHDRVSRALTQLLNGVSGGGRWCKMFESRSGRVSRWHHIRPMGEQRWRARVCDAATRTTRTHIHTRYWSQTHTHTRPFINLKLNKNTNEHNKSKTGRIKPSHKPKQIENKNQNIQTKKNNKFLFICFFFFSYNIQTFKFYTSIRFFIARAQ